MLDFDQLSPEQQAIALKLGYMGMFSHRDNLKEASEYAMKIFRATADETAQAGMITALGVMGNTIALLAAQMLSPATPVDFHRAAFCKFCEKAILLATARRHDHGWVCPACWDERLRTTE